MEMENAYSQHDDLVVIIQQISWWLKDICICWIVLKFRVLHKTSIFFLKVANSHSGVFNNTNTLLALSVAHGALISGKIKMELEKEEALNICL